MSTKPPIMVRYSLEAEIQKTKTEFTSQQPVGTNDLYNLLLLL